SIQTPVHDPVRHAFPTRRSSDLATAEPALVHATKRIGYLLQLETRLPSERVDDDGVFQLLRAFRRVGIEPPAQIVLDTLQFRGQLVPFAHQVLAQSLPGAFVHRSSPAAATAPIQATTAAERHA